MPITIDHRAWNVIRQFAARNDPRSAFNGVHVISDGRSLRLEATNGHVAAVYESEQEGLEPLEELIQPSRLPAKGSSVLSSSDDGSASFVSPDGSVLMNYISGHFPDIGRIMIAPEQCSGEPASFDARLLATAFQAFANLVPGQVLARVRLHYNGHRPAVITSTDVPQLRVVVAAVRGS